MALGEFEFPVQLNFSVYHNNDGFDEEIRQLMISLSEYKNEWEFLKNDILRLNKEIKMLKTSDSDQRKQYEELMYVLTKKNKSVKENRLNLKHAMIIFIKTNMDLFEKYRVTKQLEGQIEGIKDQIFAKERNYLYGQLGKVVISKMPHIIFENILWIISFIAYLNSSNHS